MTEKNTMDKLVDNLLTDAAKLAAKDLGNSFYKPEHIEFSEEHKLKMKKMFKKERHKQRMKSLSKYSMRVACFLLVLVIGSGITMFSVDAWRVKFLNFVHEANQPNTDYSFKDNGSITHSNYEVALEYVPMGFEMIQSDSSKHHVTLAFENENQYFHFYMGDINANSSIDTENGTVEDIIINGYEGIYTSNSNINAIIWHDSEYEFSLIGNIPKDELIKIAENIKK